MSDKAFEIKMTGNTHIFDSFECAVQALAPTCAHLPVHDHRPWGPMAEQSRVLYNNLV